MVRHDVAGGCGFSRGNTPRPRVAFQGSRTFDCGCGVDDSCRWKDGLNARAAWGSRGGASTYYNPVEVFLRPLYNQRAPRTFHRRRFVRRGAAACLLRVTPHIRVYRPSLSWLPRRPKLLVAAQRLGAKRADYTDPLS